MYYVEGMHLTEKHSYANNFYDKMYPAPAVHFNFVLTVVFSNKLIFSNTYPCMV